MEPSKGSLASNTVGIVIPVKDGLNFLKLCLYSVLYFTDYPYTMTIVDNQSGLQTKKYLRSVAQNHAIDVIRYDEEFNFAAECNRGLRYAFSRPEVQYGLILNADTVVEPDWLSKLVTDLESMPGAGLIGPYTNVGNAEQVKGRDGDLWESQRLSGFCMLIKRSTFEAVGGFDEDFKAGGFEDWDFSVRAREMGNRLIIDGDVYVHHYWRQFRKDHYTREMLANETRFFKKHPSLRKEVELRHKAV